MRVCRFLYQQQTSLGLYDETGIVPLRRAAELYEQATHKPAPVPAHDDLLACLPHGESYRATRDVWEWLQRQGNGVPEDLRVPRDEAWIQVPVPRPNKLFLLAGNYAEHIREGGGVAAERAETFPYVFMKPPSTTLIAAGEAIQLPRVSPGAIDWEAELAVVIGRTGKHIPEADALSYVAGYTVINDISNRKFRPNPGRKQRDKDSFFDWLHGKWFDGFCPCGPCVTASSDIPDPQQLRITLTRNGQVKQDSSTAHQIFPVAAVIAFISDIVTLEPGDIISTGTPSGVGNATGEYLAVGDVLQATIERIGTLETKVEPEE